MVDTARNIAAAETDENNNELLPADSAESKEPNAIVVSEIREKLQNLRPEDAVRGKTPDDIEKRCLELCQSFIGGCWSEVRGVEDITVKRVSGGFTNQLYHVKLNNAAKAQSDEPMEVAVKLYMSKHMKNYHSDDFERLNDVIILPMVSALGISPKVYGIFQDGFIQEFVKHEQFRAKHQQNPKLLRECARLQARIHNMKVPIRKDGSWLLRILREAIEFGYDQCDVLKLVEQLNLDAFKRRDLLEEFADFERIVKEVNSPLAFSHFDFRGSNILVLEADQRVMTVDMECCAYAPRAMDMASFLAEWKNELFDLSLPEDAVIEHYVQLYVEAFEQLAPGYASKPGNSVATIVREVKVFILLNMMLFVAMSLKTTEQVIEAVPFSPERKMIYVNGLYQQYLATKELLVKDGTICG